MDLMVINRLLDEIKELTIQALENEKAKKKDDPYQSEQVNEIVAALSKAQGEYPVIDPDRENFYVKSKYADLFMIFTTVQPILAKHGLSISQPTRLEADGSTIMHTRIYHSSGQWLETRARILPAKLTHQDYGAAMTYNKRYSAMAILGIAIPKDPTDDDAAESIKEEDLKSAKKGTEPSYSAKKQSYATVSPEELYELEYALVGHPKVCEDVMDSLGIHSLADMPKSEYRAAINRIRGIINTTSIARK